jgi:hypothetical protein
MNDFQKISFVIFFLATVIGCGEKRIIYLYPEDKSQCITIIDQGKFRYIVDGMFNSIPESNYIKLDVQKIDPLRDNIHVCWKNDLYEWDVVVDQSKVIESKLDPTRFNFSISLPEDDRGIPSEMKFRMPNCMVFSYYLMRLSPKSGGLVEIQ